MPFRDFAPLNELRNRFVTHLNQQDEREPRGLYEPVEYILGIGGKRVRPLLALIAARICGDDDRATYGMPVALAIEVFHNFTLLHDDIMDASPLRRGQPTVHERWNVNTAILSGDLMLIRAYGHLSEVPRPDRMTELLTSFNRVAIGVCEGQQYDVDFEERADVTIPEYLKMIELKTAVLLGGALELGALAAGASPQDAQRLYEFGRLTGLAFQLHDDLLDTFGEAAETGKRTGNDIIRNKKTYLYLKTMEGLEPNERQELADWFTQTPADPTLKVNRVTQLMREGEIPRLVAELRDQYQQEAYEQLDQVSGDEQWKEMLRKLTDSLLSRSF